MINKMILSVAVLIAFSALPAFAGTSCSTGGFVGTYTSATALKDVIGDGDLHAAVLQLTLHNDGTATQNWTGLQDYMINTGSGSLNIGAWKCRDNGNLLVTLISVAYQPAPANATYGTVDDIKLLYHYRTTYVLSLDDNDTMTRIKSRTRRYAPADDPTDPNGGTLLALNTTTVTYKRLVASAADITAP